MLVDKRIIHSPELKSNKDSFYNFMIKELLTHSNGTIVNANIYLDGHEDRSYKKLLELTLENNYPLKAGL